MEAQELIVGGGKGYIGCRYTEYGQKVLSGDFVKMVNEEGLFITNAAKEVGKRRGLCVGINLSTLIKWSEKYYPGEVNYTQKHYKPRMKIVAAVKEEPEPAAEVKEPEKQPEILGVRICPSCGKKVENTDYVFCPYCANRLETERENVLRMAENLCAAMRMKNDVHYIPTVEKIVAYIRKVKE